MKMSQLLFISLLSLIFVSATPVLAGSVNVEWHEPEKYTDVRAATGSREAFRQRVFKQLDKHFEKMANEVLPQELSLKIKVINLNLAGDVRYNYSAHRDIRLVKRIYWPSIEFEYQLLDNNNVIKSEVIKLKDLSFMDRTSKVRSRSSYHYEEQIITDWFVKDIKPMLAQLDKQKTAVMASE